MCRVGQGIHDLLVARKTAGVFQRAARGAVDQPGRRTVFDCGSAGRPARAGEASSHQSRTRRTLRRIPARAADPGSNPPQEVTAGFPGIRRQREAAARTDHWLQTGVGAHPPRQMLPAGPYSPRLKAKKPRSFNRRQISGSLSTSSTRTSRTESCPTPVPASNLSMPPVFTGLTACYFDGTTSTPALPIA
jgi:hypothetical protein